MLELIENIFWRKKKMFRVNQNKLVDHINSKWTTKMCPYCGKNNWNIGDSIVTTLSVGENKELRLGGKFQPMVSITCNNCGNTVFVNALIAEAVDVDEGEK